MRVSYQWLADYVDLDGYTAEQLAEALTRSGIEVDVVENRNQGIEQVLVGYVSSREKHPDADKLSVCKVDVGQEELLQIVCGAPNVAAGQKVPVAIVGAILPDNFKIKRAKLRGVESQGMICSAKELGMNDKLLSKELQDGILVLPEDTEIGADVLDVLALNDKVLELDLTPNRADALSMIGVAYEIGAIIGREVKLPEITLEEAGTSIEEKVRVTISAQEQSQQYTAKYIDGVTIAPSPLWMQNRLMAAGIRPINNIVDITNYVLIEYGQPLHAFDADLLAKDASSSNTSAIHIDVRLAEKGELLRTLDDVDRMLEPHMLVITDGEKPIALAGVMGGANSEVSEGTTRILLESAHFDGGTVRRTSRELGLRSEASLRFEKEINRESVEAASRRAASLIAQYAGGTVASGIVSAEVKPFMRLKLELSLNKVNSYLGTELSMDELTSIFDRLQLSYESSRATEQAIIIEVPGRKGDVTRDVDLIEEVARIYGYDRIPTTLIHGATTPGSLSQSQAVRRKIREVLTGSGLHEVINYSFVHPKHTQTVHSISESNEKNTPLISLAMPMSEDRSVLRKGIVPSLLEVANYNRNRNEDDVAVFEISNVYLSQEQKLTQLPDEKQLLALLWTGNRLPKHWGVASTPVDFYDLKGVVEKLLASLGIDSVSYVKTSLDGLHPGRTAEITVQIDGSETSHTIGWLGQIHPELQQQYDLADTYAAELSLDVIYELATEEVSFQALPKYPAIARDLALVVNMEVQTGDIVNQVKAIVKEQKATKQGTVLESVQVFDIYTGERLGAGKKSVALSLVYRNAERTLTDEEVSELQAAVVAGIEQIFAAELRK